MRATARSVAVSDSFGPVCDSCPVRRRSKHGARPLSAQADRAPTGVAGAALPRGPDRGAAAGLIDPASATARTLGDGATGTLATALSAGRTSPVDRGGENSP